MRVSRGVQCRVYGALLNCFYSLTDARLSLGFNIFWRGEIVILGIAPGIREMHRCHSPTSLSITSVIVLSSRRRSGSVLARGHFMYSGI